MGFEYYTIVSSGKSGYTFQGSRSTGGTPSGEQIIYKSPLASKTLTDNDFWYKSNTPPTENHAPIAEAGGPYTGQVGQSITLDGSGSHDDDPDDSITKYEWDLDNDGQYDDATGVAPQYTWSAAFSGSIGLRVTDTRGATGRTSPRSASVRPRRSRPPQSPVTSSTTKTGTGPGMKA